MLGKEIEVWVCPHCGHYYGSTTIEGRDLITEMNRDLKGNPTFSRAMCQMCDSKASRVKYIAIVTKKVDRTPLDGPNMTQEEYFAYLDKKARERESEGH